MNKKRFFSLILCIIIIITACFPVSVSAKEATTGKLANVVVCVRFANDDTDRFINDTDKMLMLYEDTTNLYATQPYDYSFKKYINEISRGMLNVENTFPQYDGTVITPLTLSRSLENSTDDTVLQEIIDAFNSGTISLPSGKKYDYRTNGIIDNITVILQGKSGRTMDSLMWPHKSVSAVTTKINNTYHVGNYNFIDTQSLFDSTSMQGTISHEFLHTVGFPDLYRNDGSTGVPVGRWDIMAANNMCQQYPLSYLRYTMGWVPMQTISSSGDYVLDVVTNQTSDSILFKMESPLSNSEFFMLEYRKQSATSAFNADSKKFDALVPSSGLLIYRVNTNIEYKTNFRGEDYIYVFRPDDTSPTDSAGNIFSATVNPLENETSYGSANMDASVSENTIFYSNGQNSGIVINNVTYSEDKSKISFHVEYPDYSSLDLWENVGPSITGSINSVSSAVDDNGNLFVLTNDTSKRATDLYRYTNGSWIKSANSLANIGEAVIKTFNNEIYIIYSNSSYYPVVAKLENGLWKTISTDTSSQYAFSLQLFKSNDTLYCGWVKDSTTAIIKEVNSTLLTDISNSLTASYFSNPVFTASGNYIYALYSDFFGTNKYTQLKRMNLTTKQWESLNIPTPIQSSNVHRAENNNGEIWFLATGWGTNPIVFSVKNDGQVMQKNLPTKLTNFLNIGISVNESGTLYVGLFSSSDDSEVLYLENNQWKKLGSKPCESIQAADMLVYGDRAFVASVTQTSGSLVVRSKEMPQLPTAKLIAKEGTNIQIKDNFVVGIPENAIDLSLYLEATENGDFTYTSMNTGGKINLYSADNVLIKTYTVVVRGDLNSDGFIDGTDAVLIACIAENMGGFSQTQIFAADYSGDGVVNNDDFHSVFRLGLMIK